MRATFRTAAITAGAITALALPTAQAFAADAASAAASGPTAPAEDVKRGQQGRTFVTRYENLGGSGFDARVHRTASGYEAAILDGRKADTAQYNGAHFVLNPDGTMKGWTEGAAKPAVKPDVAHPERGADAGAVAPKGAPKGGVRAGAEQVKPSADGAVLMAGGAGLAAAGAAGLGFSMLRRRRGEG